METTTIPTPTEFLRELHGYVTHTLFVFYHLTFILPHLSERETFGRAEQTEYSAAQSYESVFFGAFSARGMS